MMMTLVVVVLIIMVVRFRSMEDLGGKQEKTAGWELVRLLRFDRYHHDYEDDDWHDHDDDYDDDHDNDHDDNHDDHDDKCGDEGNDTWQMKVMMMRLTVVMIMVGN